MKRKLKFVTPTVTRAVPLYPETDLLQATSIDSAMRVFTDPQEVEEFEEGANYTIDLY